MKTFYLNFSIAILGVCLSSCENVEDDDLGPYPPKEFVQIQKVIPNIEIEARYFGNHNFMGKPAKGYQSDSLVLTEKAAQALSKIQSILKKQGFELKIFDAYRPQKAVNHFAEWAKDIKDTLNKKEFYPNLDKSELFKEGYIAEKSGHSRGSTVDLTLIFSRTKEELDMGSPYDFFGPISWTADSTLSPLQYNNRMMLKTIMEENGFIHLPQEWWHFTLVNEPYRDKYFDFDIK